MLVTNTKTTKACKQACSTKILSKFLFFVSAIATLNLNSILELPDLGTVGTEDEVYERVMANIVGFKDPQHFGPGLQEAVQRSLNRSRLTLFNLSKNDLRMINDNVYLRGELYCQESTFRAIESKMEQYKRNQIKRGRWKLPEAPEEDPDKSVISLSCCKKQMHNGCLKTNIKMGNNNCPNCMNEKFETHRANEVSTEDICVICQDGLESKEEAKDKNDTESFKLKIKKRNEVRFKPY